MGLSRLPYFQFYRAGRLVTEFTCNLTTIDVLRAALSQHQGALPNALASMHRNVLKPALHASEVFADAIDQSAQGMPVSAPLEGVLYASGLLTELENALAQPL